MTEEQADYLKNIIKDHVGAISTPEAPLGNYKLFQTSIRLFPGKSQFRISVK